MPPVGAVIGRKGGEARVGGWKKGGSRGFCGWPQLKDVFPHLAFKMISRDIDGV